MTLPRSEPVAVLDLVKAAVVIAGIVGVDIAEDRVIEVVVAVNAALVAIAATLATRRRVTPVARAEAAVEQAKAEGIAAGKHDALANALRPLTQAPAPQAPFVPPVEVKPPAGLYVPGESISETDGPTVASGAVWLRPPAGWSDTPATSATGGPPWAPTRLPPPPRLDE